MDKNPRKFNSLMLKRLCKELNGAVDAVAKKHGLTICFSDPTCQEQTATITVKLGFSSDTHNDPNDPKELWDLHCKAYGLKPDDYGKEIRFPNNEKHYILCGLSEETPKPVIISCTEEGGHKYCASVNSVLVALGHKKPPQKAVDPETARQNAKKTWDKYCENAGLQPDDFGRTFVMDGLTYRICGYDENAINNTIIFCDERTGKVYMTSPEAVKKCLGQS